jgi:hypothetical protein
MIAAMIGGNKGTRLVLVRWNVEIDDSLICNPEANRKHY